MKTKRFLSVLLALTLCLGMLPGVTLAEDNTLPNGYQQLYNKVSFSDGTTTTETAISVHAGGNDGFSFYTDSNLANALPSSAEFTFVDGSFNSISDNSLGNFVWNTRNEEFVWNASEALPNTSGYAITTVTDENNSEVTYAIAVEVENAEVGVYSTYSNSTVSGYIIPSNRTFLLNSETDTTIYLAAGEAGRKITKIATNSTTTNLSFAVPGGEAIAGATDAEDSSKLIYTIPNDGSDVIAVTVSKDVTNSFSAELRIFLGASTREHQVELNFNDGFEDETSNLPNGYTQMYFKTEDGTYITELSLALDSEMQVSGSLFTAQNNNYSSIDVLKNYNLSFSCSGLGIIDAPPANIRLWNTRSNAVAGTSGYLLATNDDSSTVYAIAVSVTSNSKYTLWIEKDTLDPSTDIMTDTSATKVGPAPFEYDADGDGQKETYYLCTMNEDNEEYNYTGGTRKLYEEGAYFMLSLRMAFWTYDDTKNDYILVSDSVKNTLKDAFSNWDVHAYNFLANEFTEYSACYPETYTWVDEEGWPFGIAFKHDVDSLGFWRYAFSGTIDGQTVTMYVGFDCGFMYSSLSCTASSVEEINSTLQAWDKATVSSDTKYSITLTATEFSGIISIPKSMKVSFTGTTERNKRTVLYGGVGGEGFASVSNIDFVGNGWKNTNWPDNTTYQGESNYGLFCDSGAKYSDCSFSNYYHALHCAENSNGAYNIIFGGDRTLFENNYIAVYMDSILNGGGNSAMQYNTFRHNGCALWLKNFGAPHIPLGAYDLIRCKFYDNGWDLVNLLGKYFFVPGIYFEHDGKYSQGKFTNNSNPLLSFDSIPMTLDEDTELYASNAADTTAAATNSGVYGFPVAMDASFDIFDYAIDAVISNENAADWLIPESNLEDKTITVVQDDAGKDVVVWSFESSTTQEE